MKNKILVLELNEINFNFVNKYCQRGLLPNFKKLFDKYKTYRTISENEYHLIEPWIQWPTFHTGKKYSEHRLFELNDYEKLDFPQIWELIESRGYKVAAISPMNAKNNLSDNSIFLSDPWSFNKIHGSIFIKILHKAVYYFVNNNVKKKFSLMHYFYLLISLVVFAKMDNYILYLKYLLKSKKKKWYRAIILDLLLFDLTRSFVNSKTDFISSFFNSAAHIQHHYLLNSSVVESKINNEEWYISKNEDPVLDVFTLYDTMIKKTLEIKDYRVILLTGLTQDLVEDYNIYYRLTNHAEFLNLIEIKYLKIESLMSRDFKIFFKNQENLNQAVKILTDCKIENECIFEFSKSDNYLFVTLKYNKRIEKKTKFVFRDNHFFADQYMSLVAIKNGIHNGSGFYIDTGNNDTLIPVKDNEYELSSFKDHLMLNYK